MKSAKTNTKRRSTGRTTNAAALLTLGGPSAHLGLRVPVGLIEMIDDEVARRTAANPGVTIGRSDVVRSLIIRGLDAA